MSSAGIGTEPWRPSARTRLAAVIGEPVGHSLSPALHNAAFRALDLDWVYLAFEVVSGDAGRALAGMSSLGIDGMSVTMPHKSDVARLVDRLSPIAAELGAVNTVVRRDGRLVGENTDGDGFVAALRADEGIDPEGRRFLVLGAGGAARAVVRAVAAAGADEVLVVARRPEAAEMAAALGHHVGRVGRIEQAGEVDVVVDATPAGMSGTADRLAIDPDRLAPGQLVVDLVYEPLVTPLVAEARARGVAAVNGLGMLVHQAAAAFRMWTGEDPPLEVLSGAALGALRARST